MLNMIEIEINYDVHFIQTTNCVGVLKNFNVVEVQC